MAVGMNCQKCSPDPSLCSLCLEVFNNQLMDFCLWYNIEKPHKGLNKLPTLKYYVNEFVKQPAQSNMSWTPILLTKDALFNTC